MSVWSAPNLSEHAGQAAMAGEQVTIQAYLALQEL